MIRHQRDTINGMGSGWWFSGLKQLPIKYERRAESLLIEEILTALLSRIAGKGRENKIKTSSWACLSHGCNQLTQKTPCQYKLNQTITKQDKGKMTILWDSL